MANGFKLIVIHYWVIKLNFDPIALHYEKIIMLGHIFPKIYCRSTFLTQYIVAGTYGVTDWSTFKMSKIIHYWAIVFNWKKITIILILFQSKIK